MAKKQSRYNKIEEELQTLTKVKPMFFKEPPEAIRIKKNIAKLRSML